MKHRLLLACCALLFSSVVRAADGPAVWQSVSQPVFDPAKAARVSALQFTRDAIEITLEQGTIQFAKPANGVVFASSFRGTGRLRVKAADWREGQQLQLFTGSQELLDIQFSEAVLSFSDGFYNEIAARLRWEDGAADPALAANYMERQEFRENYGAEFLPRLVKGILSANKGRTALFYGEFRTADKGWIFVAFDALDPETIRVGRWQTFGAARFRETWMHFPASGRSTSDAWRNPVEHEDVLPQAYRIFATVTSSAELKARTLVTLKPQWDGESMWHLFLDSNLRVQSVKDPTSGKNLEFIQVQERKDRPQSYGNYIAVFLPEATKAGTQYELEFIYEGKRVVRQMGAGVYFCQSFGWYPAVQNFAHRSNFDLVFRSPKRYALTATGAKISENSDGDELVTEWRSEKPIAVAGFAYGEVKIEIVKVGDIEVLVYANKQPDDLMANIARATQGNTGVALGTLTPASMASQIATEMANSIRVFEHYFGSYPYKRLAISTIPFGYGQGWPSLIYLSALSFMDSFQRKQFGFSQRNEKSITDFFRAHETSHQWWGHKVAWKSYHDQWLSEGFAEFSGNLYLQKRSGNVEYIDRLRESRKNILLKDQNGHTFDAVGPIWMGLRLNSSESPRAYQLLVYEKGGFVLHMLRMMLFNSRAQDPDSAFRAMMRQFTSAYDNAAASTEDFKAVAEKHLTAEMNLDGNGRLDWFFNQYVYGTGVPTYDFKYSIVDAGGGQWKLKGTVTQSGVPAGWKDVLPLYLEVNGNMHRVGTINVTKPVVELDEVMPVKPTRVILCHNEDSIAVIKQP